MHGVPRLVKALAVAILTSLAWSASATPVHIETQRKTFNRALPIAQSGTWQQVVPYVADLEDYPLLPDLRVAWLHRRLGRHTDAEVAAVLEQYPELGFTSGLRKRWAESLRRRQQWDDYLDIYVDHFADAKDNAVHCKALDARLRLPFGAAESRTWVARVDITPQFPVRLSGYGSRRAGLHNPLDDPS